MIKVTASGHLAADAQLRTFTTQDGRSFTRLSGRVVSSGRGQNASPVGISFTITNEKRAQALAGILKKGLAVTVHGDFNERKSPDGRYFHEIVVDDIDFLSAQGQRQQNQPYQNQGGYAQPQPAPQPAPQPSPYQGAPQNPYPQAPQQPSAGPEFFQDDSLPF